MSLTEFLGVASAARCWRSAARPLLHTGDCLVLYSDGVTDATNVAGESFDPDRVRAWLTGSRDEDARALTDRAFADLLFGGGTDSPPSTMT